MSNNVISIVRQFGSLGRQVGKQVAEIMGYNYYDRDIIEKAAIHLGKNVDELAKYEGHSPGYNRMIAPLGYGSDSKQMQLFEVEKSIILEHAQYEDCVIIGRGSDYILKDKTNAINVFVYAPYQERMLNCMDELNLSHEDAAKYIDKVDKARRGFYKMIGGSSWDSMQNRDLMIDSSKLGVRETAEVIAEYASLRFKRVSPGDRI